MHPTLRQTPPSVAYRSIRTVRRPRSAARKAAAYPPGPEPSTTTSQSTSVGPLIPGSFSDSRRATLLVFLAIAGGTAGCELLPQRDVLPRELGECGHGRFGHQLHDLALEAALLSDECGDALLEI